MRSERFDAAIGSDANSLLLRCGCAKHMPVGGLYQNSNTFIDGWRVFLRLDDLYPRLPHIWSDGIKMDAKGEMYIGQSPRSLDAPGMIIVVNSDAKLVRTLGVPSPSMPNFAFGPGEKKLYVMALDQIDKAPWQRRTARLDKLRLILYLTNQLNNASIKYDRPSQHHLCRLGRSHAPGHPGAVGLG